jgi:hypothetical protein
VSADAFTAIWHEWLCEGEVSMLEQSTKVLEEASTEAKAAAEEMAFAMITADLMQDLIPAERAHEIAEEHRIAGDEEWRRAVHACLIGLAVLNRRGNLQGLDAGPRS